MLKVQLSKQSRANRADCLADLASLLVPIDSDFFMLHEHLVPHVPVRVEILFNLLRLQNFYLAFEYDVETVADRPILTYGLSTTKDAVLKRLVALDAVLVA